MVSGASTHLLDSLVGLSGDKAFSVLARWSDPLDWDVLPAELPLTDGARLTFDRRQRRARIEQVNGGTSVFDLGRPDRMRRVDQVLTPDLVAHAGPAFEVRPKNAWGITSGELALRDPLDRKRARSTDLIEPGVHGTSRFVDGQGRTRLVAVGDMGTLSGFGTFLMDGGGAYAHLRTASGLGCFYDSSRLAFMKAVTDEVTARARTEGFALVVTNAGPVGVVFDCGAPGDYLALSAYHRSTGGASGIVVDLRRPPVKDGAIMDPPTA
jgi:hypothetical protein